MIRRSPISLTLRTSRLSNSTISAAGSRSTTTALRRSRRCPQRAITLTIPRLLRADRLFCVVPGPHKRDAVDRTLHGPVATGCPASVLRRHEDCILYLDAESDPDA